MLLVAPPVEVVPRAEVLDPVERDILYPVNRLVYLNILIRLGRPSVKPRSCRESMLMKDHKSSVQCDICVDIMNDHLWCN
jgi:hypothetical protein